MIDEEVGLKNDPIWRYVLCVCKLTAVNVNLLVGTVHLVKMALLGVPTLVEIKFQLHFLLGLG